MLYQVLQLTCEQINALPPAERDAIQQFVGPRSPVIHVASFAWTAGFSFVIISLLPSLMEESVHGWGHHRFMPQLHNGSTFDEQGQAQSLYSLQPILCRLEHR